jgi:hypothetical protein
LDADLAGFAAKIGRPENGKPHLQGPRTPLSPIWKKTSWEYQTRGLISMNRKFMSRRVKGKKEKGAPMRFERIETD